MSKVYDVIIIGAGPAGLAAALYAGRARLSTLVIEKIKDGGQIVITDEIENYPGAEEGESGPSLIKKMVDQVNHFGAEKVFDTVVDVELEGDIKVIKGSKAEYQGKTAIIATGASPKPIGCPGEKELTGKGVSYCATCDGMLYRGRAVAVWGLSPEAPQEANFLHGIGCSVTYIAGRRPDTLDAGVAFRAGRVEAVEGGAAVEAVRVGGAALPVQGVFILRAATPPDALVPGLALENGFVKTDAAMRTNIPGLFAAGDMTGKPLQVANAVGDGLVAALAAVDYLDGVSPMTD